LQLLARAGNPLVLTQHASMVEPQPIRAAVAYVVSDNEQGGDCMKLKDATRSLGSVGYLLPLILIFLIAAAATYACPGTRVVYRTRTVSRTAPMGTTLITYGGQPCSESAYAPRPTRYVAVRGNSYYSSGPRYVSVRSYDSYAPVRRARYVAVRSDDIDYAPSRYVVVRRQPAYVETPTRYVTVRSYAPQTRYVAVRYNDIDADDVDYDYSPHYVAVRRQPVYQTRYVAVGHMDSDYDDDDYVAPARYVPVRNVNNACACGVSSLNDVETIAPRHVVVKTDYIAGTRDAIVPRSSYDDTAYMTVPGDRLTTARYVNYSAAAYSDDNNATYLPASYVTSPRVRTISYVPADNDYDDEAIPDADDAAYVATDDVGDACLSRVAVQAPMEMNTQTVSYVPADDVDYDASLSGSQPTYIVNEAAAPATSYVSDVDDDSDMDTTYVATGNVGASCSCPVAFQNPVALRTFEDDLGYHTVTAISADNMAAFNTVPVSYASIQDVNYVPANETNLADVNYVPTDEMNVDNDSYVPAQSVSYADTADTDAVVQPTSENSVVTDDSSEVTEPEPVAVDSTQVVAEPDMSADMTATQAAANDAGYRDGLADGQNAALNGEENRPGDSENFQNATDGYVDTLGDANTYSDAYRSAYLQGFSSGYNSEIGP